MQITFAVPPTDRDTATTLAHFLSAHTAKLAQVGITFSSALPLKPKSIVEGQLAMAGWRR